MQVVILWSVNMRKILQRAIIFLSASYGLIFFSDLTSNILFSQKDLVLFDQEGCLMMKKEVEISTDSEGYCQLSDVNLQREIVGNRYVVKHKDMAGQLYLEKDRVLSWANFGSSRD